MFTEIRSMSFKDAVKTLKGVSGLYVCERQDNTVKCGFSTNLAFRIKGLKGLYTNLTNPRVTIAVITPKTKCGRMWFMRDVERRFFNFLPDPCIWEEIFPCTYEAAVDHLHAFVRKYNSIRQESAT